MKVTAIWASAGAVCAAVVVGLAGCGSEAVGGDQGVDGGRGGTGAGGPEVDARAEAAAAGDDAATAPPDAPVLTDAQLVDASGGGCHPVAAAHPDEGALHYDQLCSPTNYQTNPPSSGNHYGTWAAYKTYPTTFPSGFWVHNLEHGAIVITYHCDDGCPTEVAAAQSLIDSLPVDPACDAVVKRRIVMLPDPNLSARFAASSWGFTLRADCFDAPAFTDFIAEHYNHGREDLCADGLDPLTGRGGSPICAP